MATCRDCAHYDREAHRNAGGKIVMRKGRAARCLFNPELLIREFPLSVPGFRLRPSWMRPDDGKGCPQWTMMPAAASGKEQDDG